MNIRTLKHLVDSAYKSRCRRELRPQGSDAAKEHVEPNYVPEPLSR